VDPVPDAEVSGKLQGAGETDVGCEVTRAVLVSRLAETGLEKDREHSFRAPPRDVRKLDPRAPMIDVAATAVGRGALAIHEGGPLRRKLIPDLRAEGEIRLDRYVGVGKIAEEAVSDIRLDGESAAELRVRLSRKHGRRKG